MAAAEYPGAAEEGFLRTYDDVLSAMRNDTWRADQLGRNSQRT